jgi:cytochrome c553
MNNPVFIKLILCVVACTAAALPAGAQERSAARDLASSCFTCHGTDGNSSGGIPPSLAGRASGEVFQMMKDFQSGKRPATVMHQQARGYTDAQLKLIASYFESVKPTPARAPAKP